MKKKMALALVLVIAVLTGGILLSINGKDAVSVYAQKKDSLLAAEQLNVSFQQVGGRVTDVLVQEGQFVGQDTALIELDTRDLDLQIEKLEIQMASMDYQIAQAQASLKSYDINAQQYAVQTAQSTLDTVQKSYDRVEALYSAGAVSEASLEEAQLKLTAAQNALNQSQETLQKLQNNFTVSGMNVAALAEQKKALAVQMISLLDQKDRMILRAPADGTILRVIPKAGENVTANAPVVILQSKQLYFDLYVPETQVNFFTIGDSVPLQVVATDKTMSGVVRYIISAPQYTSNRMSRDNSQGDLSSFQIRIFLEGDTENLLPGMTVEVKLDESNER